MLNKTQIAINFSSGLDTKTDPWQVTPGKFLSLENSVFTKGGQLNKRNGYNKLASLPNTTYSYLTTLNGNLTALGPTISAYNTGSGSWVSKGSYVPMEVNILPLVRNNLNQIQSDIAIAGNLVCTVYTETDGSIVQIKYAVADAITGQNIVAPSVIPVSVGTPTGSARVFVLANYFIIVFTNLISATSHLQYVVINRYNPTVVSPNVDLAANYTPSAGLSWDAVVANNKLYIAYNTLSGGQAVVLNTLTSTLVVGSPHIFSGQKATLMSVTADLSGNTPNIYASYYDSVSTNGHLLAVDQSLNTLLAPTQIITGESVLNITSIATLGVASIYYEIDNSYSYDSTVPAHFVKLVTCTQSGTVSASSIVVRSLGLASKAFYVNSKAYFLGAYQSSYQPTYFLVDGSSTEDMPKVIAKLAYQNGGGYLALGLPNVVVNDNEAQFPYLFKDLIAAVNKNTNVSAGTQVNGIYSQTGINLGSFVINSTNIDSVEIGQDLLLSGGFLWMYDGYLPVEQNFLLYPDNVELAATTGGSMTPGHYFYQVTYEWTDNQGNAYRSAPSIPVDVTLTSETEVLVFIPTLRLTYKVASPVKIVIYRWSAAQEIYYQVTSINQPVLNSTATDSVVFTDTLSDATILGNNILYTTGGVVEDVGPPATNIMTLFDTRMWLVDAEDQNLLWFSKQVIESTPVEMSDLFTLYVAPTTAAQGSTGPITALAPMDDKLIIFKQNAIYFLNGQGPDNTGAQNQYSQPIGITATVGCTNQQSIVFTPNGLMFQSGKGIWLLGRDLSTQYVGAPVEQYNNSLVQSAVNVPQTNQVRFTLSTGQTLMYDYYYGQWGTFIGVSAISSCVYQGLHTFINSLGAAYQESPGSYLDGSVPVQMAFSTSWFNLAGLQGYERFYDFYLLGQYISPHFLIVSVGYDYGPASQQSVISPDNYSGPWGSDATWGASSPWGGPSNLEQWRVHTRKQTCQSFQISVQEVFNPAFSTVAGAGLTLSGLNCRVGIKKNARPIKAVNSVG